MDNKYSEQTHRLINALAYTYLWLGDIWTERNKEISSVSNENIS